MLVYVGVGYIGFKMESKNLFYILFLTYDLKLYIVGPLTYKYYVELSFLSLITIIFMA